MFSWSHPGQPYSYPSLQPWIYILSEIRLGKKLKKYFKCNAYYSPESVKQKVYWTLIVSCPCLLLNVQSYRTEGHCHQIVWMLIICLKVYFEDIKIQPLDNKQWEVILGSKICWCSIDENGMSISQMPTCPTECFPYIFGLQLPITGSYHNGQDISPILT